MLLVFLRVHEAGKPHLAQVEGLLFFVASIVYVRFLA
jgi:hypothetical protein